MYYRCGRPVQVGDIIHFGATKFTYKVINIGFSKIKAQFLFLDKNNKEDGDPFVHEVRYCELISRET